MPTACWGTWSWPPDVCPFLPIQHLSLVLTFFFFFLAMLLGLWDLSSPTRG